MRRRGPWFAATAQDAANATPGDLFTSAAKPILQPTTSPVQTPRRQNGKYHQPQTRAPRSEGRPVWAKKRKATRQNGRQTRDQKSHAQAEAKRQISADAHATRWGNRGYVPVPAPATHRGPGKVSPNCECARHGRRIAPLRYQCDALATPALGASWSTQRRWRVGGYSRPPVQSLYSALRIVRLAELIVHPGYRVV